MQLIKFPQNCRVSILLVIAPFAASIPTPTTIHYQLRALYGCAAAGAPPPSSTHMVGRVPCLDVIAVHAKSSFNKKYYELLFEGPGYSYYYRSTFVLDVRVAVLLMMAANWMLHGIVKGAKEFTHETNPEAVVRCGAVRSWATPSLILMRSQQMIQLLRKTKRRTNKNLTRRFFSFRKLLT